jgi:Tfp pilus assembly protein PilO
MNRVIMALGIFALLVGAYVILVEPLTEKRSDLKDRLEMNYATLKKSERFIEKTQKTGVRLEDARRELEEVERYVIQSTDTSLAFAELQAKVQDMARASGVKVTSIKPFPTVDYNGYKGLPIYMEGMGGIKDLSQFLKSIDSTEELIRVDRLKIQNSRQDSLKIAIQFSGLMKQ